MINFRKLGWLLPAALAVAACAGPAKVTPAAAPTNAPTVVPATVVPTVAPTAAPATRAATAAGTGLFFVRPEAGAGPLLAYDLASGQLRYSLPAGRLSADGQHYFAVAADGAQTVLSGFDLASGAARLHTPLAGQWTLGAVSSDGRWVGLARTYAATQTAQWTEASYASEVQLIDGHSGAPAETIPLAGNFEIDGLSTAGDALYLIQYLPALKPDHYAVRLYDRQAKGLQEGAIVDKRETDEVMVGDRWQAVGAPDGEWLLSLYLRPKAGTAFVHALNLANRYAWCIDLPFQASTLDQLKNSTLALAPNGHTLFAANAALGQVAQMDLNDVPNGNLPAARFPAANPALLANPLPSSSSAVAPDGHSLYFTNGVQAWVFDPQQHAVRAFGAAGPILGVGVSADGRRVYLARPGQPLNVLDAASGASLGF